MACSIPDLDFNANNFNLSITNGRTDGRTDGRAKRYIPSPTLFDDGIIKLEAPRNLNGSPGFFIAYHFADIGQKEKILRFDL